MIDLAIKTIDRSPRKNFLGDTMRNLERSGVFESKVLGKVYIVDGGSSNVGQYLAAEKVEKLGRTLQVDHGVRTMHQNAQRCIELASSGTADWALVIEDDIDVCDRFLESAEAWLEDHVIAAPTLYALGANYDQITWLAGHTDATYWSYHPNDFYGALACAWQRKVAVDLAAWLGPDPYCWSEHEQKAVRSHGHDLLLGRWGKMNGVQFRAAVPNFIQHIGIESTLNNKPVEYIGWAGREWSYKRKAA